MKKIISIAVFVVMLFTTVCYADAIGPEIYVKNNNTDNNYIIYVIIAIVIVAVSCLITMLINKNNKKGE